MLILRLIYLIPKINLRIVNYLKNFIRLDKLRMKLLLLLIIYVPSGFSVECQWWQTKYSATVVNKHPKKGKVREHPRREYCRDRWLNANLFVKKFNDDPILGWSHKGEVFKKWSRDEIQLILEILPTLPSWTELQNYNFRRAKDSIYRGNPAASELTNGSIILYDLFFKEKNKKSIIVHESSHHLYKKVSPKDIADFLSMSRWSVEVTLDRKVYESPPKKLIQPDSALDKDEDFANHLESYYQNPKLYKYSYPKLYDFFKRRYPL